MEILGYITLTIFIAAMLLMLFRKLNFPVQTVLIAVSLICLVVGAVFRSFTEGWVGVILLPNEMIGGIILHPITALLAGLFLSGALTASGGFGALKILINKLRKTPIGLAGTLVILIQLPVIASLPCGRIIGAALLPLLFAFGFEGGMGLLTRAQLIVLIGSFARNAFGSCGPSPIGGVGQIGEGFLGAFFPTASEGILRAPQAFSLMLGTAITALFLKFISMKLYPKDVSLRDLPEGGMEKKRESEVRGSFRGYLSLMIFLASLLISIFQPFGKMPVQTVLVAGGILMIILCRITIRDMMGGIILLPVSAMAAGFLAAGALAATGGFNALGNILKGFSNIPFLGIAGMLAIFVQIQTILPLSCSRILTAALVPVLYLFGPAKFDLITWPQLAIVMAAYMINATTSCGPSPLGGAGMMAEGTMRAETGYIKGAFTFSSMAVMAPLAAIYMKFLTLSSFPASGLQFERNVWMIIGFTVIIFAANAIMIKLTNIFLSGNVNRDWWYQLLGFVIPGAIGGAILAFCLYETAFLPIIQGTIGGIIAALLIGLMVPKRLGPTETVE
ncbi:MAG: hypothetical protein CO012_03855 [Syntrophobacterales bacterium CG_4_8_14_3_um_filter_49_14]|nr:MAG: hypothetical protein COX52_05265 [Syntrophobacterales bacterium CG23_combo_of_CG06-09_8_20_14_all_48_27]PJC75241.1 MAG: hypothetical protein CO012_03855 [Syntrophobacterales bacterium CG_4_8_14_3_um_filter_49_14]